MRTAVIGVGSMGRRHVQVVRNLGLDLVAICDQKPEALEQTGREYNIAAAHHFTDAPAMLEQIAPACVIISTTVPTHADYTCLAAQVGARYILCEKPMAASLAECDRMLETCRQHGTSLAVNHPIRFMPFYQAAREIVESDAFGGLTSVTVVGGNFGMAMNGSHFFEMFRYVADEEPVEVMAWFSPERVPNPRGPQFEDRGGTVRLTSASGKRFYLEAGADQGHGINVVYAGRHGMAVLDTLLGTLHVSLRQEEHRSAPTTRYALPRTARTHEFGPVDTIGAAQGALQALLEAGDIPSGEDGRLVMAVLVAAYVSNETNHMPVRLDSPDLPRERHFPWA